MPVHGRLAGGDYFHGNNLLFCSMRKILPLFALCLYFTAAAQIDPKKITIARDSFGVPHIFAKSDAEVSYGLAWAHAEDDFKSIQEMLLPAKGKMGRYQGRDGATADFVFELLHCREVTLEKWHTLRPDFIRLLEGYDQGLNDYAKAHPEEVLVKGMFPVTPQEHVAASVLALAVFNGADDALMQIFGGGAPAAPGMQLKGSNGIAIHPSKTTTGEAFLAINAHQPNEGPQAFYEAHICSEEGLNALGGLLAGGPCILHGVNEHLGWAHTVNYCDRVDIFQLEMNPENSNEYRFDGAWLKLETKKVKLHVKGVPVAVGRTAYWSKYGATIKTNKGVFAVRTGGNMVIGALQQWYDMNKARNFTEFYKTLQQQELSMFNILYADKYDTIFYINNALMPVRDASDGYNWRLTVPGNTAKTLWTEFRKPAALPQYINPQSGFLFNTNHSSFLATGNADNLKAENFAKEDGWEQGHNNRSMRLYELMPGGKLDFATFKKIKFDKQLPKQLQYRVKIDAMFTLQAEAHPALKDIITTFQQWDRNTTADSKGAAVFRSVFNNLRYSSSGQVTEAQALAAFQAAYDYQVKNFGRTGITLGDMQKLVRGGKEYPMYGMPDVLSAEWTEAYGAGKEKVVGGDGYICLVRFPKTGLPIIETVNMYGASSKPGSKHFDDQVPLYLKQQTKPMTLDKAAVLQRAERVYHPGE